MRSETKRPFHTIFIKILLVNLIILSALSLADAQTPTISRDSINFLQRTGEAMAEVAAAVKPAIVNISIVKTEKVSSSDMDPFLNDPFFKKFFGDRRGYQEKPREHKSMSLGSGVIVSEDGYILTNNHVIKNADAIKVLLSDKREFKGRVIGSDPKTDLSVIKIDADNLTTIEMGNSDRLKVGELVLAVGSPYGLNQTITMGIVSAVGRANVGIADYEDFIQTDAAINPGNSGGALVNVQGQIVGINTAIFSTTGGYQGIGFAIPSNMAKAVMESLINKGKVTRGWFGVSIQSITPELAAQFGLENDYGTLVADVIVGSPAEEAGLMRGDVIIKFNGKPADEPYNLRNIVAATLPNEEVVLEIIRNGEPMTINVIIGELPDDIRKVKTEFKNALRGINVQNLTPDINRQLDLPDRIRGVVVTEIEGGSPAETALLPGDVILEITRKAVSSVSDYEEIVSKIKPDQDILLLVFRRGATSFITINAEE